MAGAPQPGWYADPAGGPGHRYWDGSQWTSRTRSSSTDVDAEMFTPDRSRSHSGLWVGLGLVVVAAAGAGVWWLVGSGSGGSSADVDVPASWALYTSETGVMSYAVDPAWSDVLLPTDQDDIHDLFSDSPGMKSEFSGFWLLDGSEYSDEGTWLMIAAISDGTRPGSLQFEAKSFAVADVDDIEYLLDEEFTTPQGYPGWRVDYIAEYDGTAYPEMIIAIEADTTLIYLYAWSTTSLDRYVDDIIAVADSIVVHHPPTES